MNTEQVEALTVWATTSLPRSRLAPFGSLAIHESITGKNGRDQAGLRQSPNKLLARPVKRAAGPRGSSETTSMRFRPRVFGSSGKRVIAPNSLGVRGGHQCRDCRAFTRIWLLSSVLLISACMPADGPYSDAIRAQRGLDAGLHPICFSKTDVEGCGKLGAVYAPHSQSVYRSSTARGYPFGDGRCREHYGFRGFRRGSFHTRGS